MITACLMGGLGNQMSQYAACLAQAHRLGTGLRLATGWYGSRPGFRYGLGGWEGVDQEAVDGMPVPTVVEQGPAYDPLLGSRVRDGDCLSGYWQDERYFLGIRGELLGRFIPRPLAGDALGLAGEIGEEGGRAVALSVRRGGDYRERGIMLPMEYYQRACALVAGKVRDPRFFVFSDDPGWCRDNLQLPYRSSVVDRPDAEAGRHEDLWLMSLCHHAVLANSTFSWWGAWLSRTPGTVVAPEGWFPCPPGEWTGIRGWGLHELSGRWGTDKGPPTHSYIPCYERLLEGMDARRVLEVGIGSPECMGHVPGYRAGASLRMWADYFPQAEVWGLDSNPASLVNEGRIRSLLCDQGSEGQLRATQPPWAAGSTSSSTTAPTCPSTRCSPPTSLCPSCWPPRGST